MAVIVDLLETPSLLVSARVADLRLQIALLHENFAAAARAVWMTVSPYLQIAAESICRIKIFLSILTTKGDIHF
jgi:hypothetical protein